MLATSLALVGVMTALLCGCSTSASIASAPTKADWIDFGKSVHAFDAVELERQYAAVSQEHSTVPSSETAIKLALLVGDPRAHFYDPDRALRLLDDVLSSHAEDATSEFARFMRGLISQLSMTQAALVAERELRQTLQGQLDALKALEERLNADELER